MTRLSELPVVERLIALHMDKRIVKSTWDDFKSIPANDRIEYSQGIWGTKMPLYTHEICAFIIDIEELGTTGQILHDCKKIATVLSGGFQDEVSGVIVHEGKSLTWYANTPHTITGVQLHTKVFVQMFNPNIRE